MISRPVIRTSDQQFTRNVSAEIFVVCRGFLAPKTIDPKFLDPKHVFKDLDTPAHLDKGTTTGNAQANVFQPDKKRRHRDGYADNDYTLFKQIGVSEFIHAPDPISVLGTVNKMAFTTEEEMSYVRQPLLDVVFLFTRCPASWASLPLTSSDVKANLDDLKVLGKGDFKTLLKWRIALREDVSPLSPFIPPSNVSMLLVGLGSKNEDRGGIHGGS
jgi:AdoMet-dependent rRNA methyltransferase SPB1